jgi:hypothetical protein
MLLGGLTISGHALRDFPSGESLARLFRHDARIHLIPAEEQAFAIPFPPP